MEDGRIVELFWARDGDAVGEAQRKYGKYLRKIAVNVLGDPRDAEEAVQDGLMGAWDAIPPAQPDSLAAFIGKLTRRAALKRLRERLAEKRGGGSVPEALEELEDCLPDGARVEDTVEARELAGAIDAFLDGLSDMDRRIFLRRYWYMDPVKDIASRFGLTQSKVKMTLKRRRDELREALRREGYII